jgi:hypothetical protein
MDWRISWKLMGTLRGAGSLKRQSNTMNGDADLLFAFVVLIVLVRFFRESQRRKEGVA